MILFAQSRDGMLPWALRVVGGSLASSMETGTHVVYTWAKIAAASDGTLSGLTPIAVPVPAKTHLWRLRTKVADQAAARNLCAALVQRKLVCVVAKD